MNEPGRKRRAGGQLDRHVSDEEIFEHVIRGVRMNHVLQMLRDLDVLAQHPRLGTAPAADEPDECSTH